MISEKELDALAGKIADDLHLTDIRAPYEIGQAIIEHQDEIDLSDYQATLRFIEDLFKPLNI